jgi:hypothetical protein
MSDAEQDKKEDHKQIIEGLPAWQKLILQMLDESKKDKYK